MKIGDHARELRRNMTKAERKLWRALRDRQVLNRKFRRQEPIGRFIVDFVCEEKCLIIELDGGQHAEQEKADAARTRWLESQGYSVLRFWNNDVFQRWDGVLESIMDALQKNSSPSP